MEDVKRMRKTTHACRSTGTGPNEAGCARVSVRVFECTGKRKFKRGRERRSRVRLEQNWGKRGQKVDGRSDDRRRK
jgi:hypothetical protein